MKKVSIVIPVYNEEDHIGKTIDIVTSSNTKHYEKEIVIVDDGSTDDTVSHIRSKLSKLKEKNALMSIRFIEKRINEGKAAALKDGFLQTTGDVVIVQDADLEYSPSDYPLLLEPFLENEADVVYGSRFISDRPHRVLYYWHYVANMFLTRFSNMMTNLNFTDMETGYKVFKGGLIRSIAPHLESKRFGFEPEITARIAKLKNLKIYEVGISYWGRTYKEGKKIGWKDGILAIWEIVKFNMLK